jgi:hypothetical protein
VVVTSKKTKITVENAVYLCLVKSFLFILRILNASTEVGLEVNPEKTKYMLVSEGRTEAEHKDSE